MNAVKTILCLILGITAGVILFSHNASATRRLASPSLNAAADSANPMNVVLTWGDIFGETGYTIERKGSGSENFTEIAKLGPAITSYQDITTTAQSYDYRVRAYRIQGGQEIYSNYSNVVSITTLALTAATSTSGGTIDTTSSS